MNGTFQAALLLTAATTTQAAWAHTQAQPPSTEASATSGDGRLTDIVVTAQKRSERLQKVPIAITTVDAQALEARSIQSTLDLPQVAPGLNVRENLGLFLPTIRGIGTSAGFTENPVALYVDGVYVVDQRAALLDLADVEQVAVLKGPQGTLFGRNSTGGVLQITTRRPGHDVHVRVRASVDNYSTIRTDGYLSGPITSNLSASLSAHYATQRVGWGKNLTTGDEASILRHAFSVRGKLAFNPDEATTVTLIGQHLRSRFDGTTVRPIPGTTFSFPGFGPTRTPYDTYTGSNSVIRNEGDSASLSFERNLGFGRFVSISSYQHADGPIAYDPDGVAAPLFFITFVKAPSDAFTQEVQLVSNGDSALSWTVGAFYIHNKQRISPANIAIRPPYFPAPALVARNSLQTTKSISGFGQLTLRLGDATRVTGGVRYTKEDRDFEGTQTLQIGGGAPFALSVKSSTSVDKPTFRASLDHNFTPDILGYVSYNRGFKSGGYNLIAITNPAYKPETIDAYEAGIKSELFDRHLRVNAAVFYYDYKNIQISQLINNVSTISNAAAARIYGLDFDFEARLSRQLSISGGLEPLHATYTSFDNAQFATPRPSGGALITAGSAAGNRLSLAQKFSANAALDYDFPVGGADGHFNVSAAYQGNYPFEPDNVIRQPSYVMLNSSLKFTLPGGRVSATLFGKNLLGRVPTRGVG